MTSLVVLALAWTGGILLAQAFSLPWVWLLPVLPPVPVLLGGWGHCRWARRISLALVGLLLGAVRLTLARTPITPGHLAYYNGAGPVEVVGVVVAEPDPRAGDTRVRVQASQLRLPDDRWVEVRGKVLVYAPAYGDVAYGDRLRAVGSLTTPPVFEDFSYRDYLARRGIHTMMQNAQIEVVASHQANPVLDRILAFKGHVHRALLRMIPEPEASLLSGILLGIERDIPDSLLRAFEVTGTSHIVAISGFNLTVVAAVFARTARRVFKSGKDTLIALIGLWLYVVLVGASAAVARAGVMASIAILAQRERRPIHGPTSIAAATLALSIGNPFVLWDVGFQLSLAATLGLVLYAPLLGEGVERGLARLTNQARAEKIAVALSDPFLVTVAAQITTLGITASVFHSLSLVTLLTNLLILPVQTLIMVVGGTAALLAAVWQPLGQIPAWIAWGFLRFTTGAVRWTAGFPRAAMTLEGITPAMAWGYYAVLAVGTAWALHPRIPLRGLVRKIRAVPNGWAATGGMAVGLVILALMTAPGGRLQVAVLAVGVGDAIYVRTPRGRQVVIDGGPEPSRTLDALGRRMPFWDRSLDLVVLTSPDRDRLPGLIPILERMAVDAVGYAPEVGEGPVYDRWWSLLANRASGTSGLMTAGQRWALDREVALEVLWPPVDGVGPLILMLRYGDIRWLLAGDATPEIEAALVERCGDRLRADVLILPRHGDPTSGSPGFLQAVDPEMVVVSTGPASSPSPYALSRLVGRRLFRTDRDGTLLMRSDGRHITVRNVQP
jgi:competence protein ComEC